MNSNDIGAITEGVVMAALLKRDWRVLLPFGGGIRYDMVIQDRDGGPFLRVQCKTAKLRNGCIIFNSCSQGGSKGGSPRKDYREDADFFGVYCPDNGKAYLVHVSAVALNEGRLRVEPAKNGQRTRMADQYEI